MHTDVIYCPKEHKNEKSYTSAPLYLHSVDRNNSTCTWTLVLSAQSSKPLYQNNNERGITYTLFIQSESGEDESWGKTPLGLQFLCSPSTGNPDCRHGRGMLLQRQPLLNACVIQPHCVYAELCVHWTRWAHALQYHDPVVVCESTNITDNEAMVPVAPFAFVGTQSSYISSRANKSGIFPCCSG